MEDSYSVEFGDSNRGIQIGVNYGPIYPPLGRPETPPSPSPTVPFRRDQDFVERRDLLDQIQQRCAVPASWTALVGLGGVGKSQLAIEYAYRTLEQSPETWVFWVHASNAARFEQSYRNIADTAKIFGRGNSKANVFKLVHDWLCDSKRKWRLILDNVDDARFLLDDQQLANLGERSGQLREYLPQSQNGSILITSRSMEAVLKLTEASDAIEVEPMDEAHALALFKKKFAAVEKKFPINNKDIAELATTLEYMPLAIVQAAAYISQRAPRRSARQYLEELQKNDQRKTSLLNHEGGQLRRDREAKNSIIATWQISFDYIQQSRPSAADLLSLMSFFDRQGIPESLLGRPPERDGQQEAPQSSTSDEFEDDVLMLRNYSFIAVTPDGTFEMHSLVQLAMRTWLEANGQLEKWKQQSLSNLCNESLIHNRENWASYRILLPHAKLAAEQQPKESLAEWATVLYCAAWYSWRMANSHDTEKLALKSMTARAKLFGQEHEDTLNSMEMVGLAHDLSGNLNKAAEVQLELLATRKRVLGAEHPQTLTAISNLAVTYRGQGHWKEAEKLIAEELEISKRVRGAEHPSTLISISSLAYTIGNQGRLKEAEELEVQVLDAFRRVLGAENPSTLVSLGNLAATYVSQGRWKEAEELQTEELEISNRVLGTEHPSTLTTKANLASTFWHQGRLKEAEELGEEVMQARLRVLGAEHPSTLTSMFNLASTYRDQRRCKKAKELDLEVVKLRKRVLGTEHPDTLMSISNLAATLWDLGETEEAEALEAQVMDTRKRVLGAEHPDTLVSMHNLAFTWKRQDRVLEAIELMESCTQLQTKVLGAEHPDTLMSISNLAATLWDLGETEQTEALEVQVMNTRKKVLGTEHPDTLISMYNLAFTWKRQDRVLEAIELMESCTQLQTEVLGAEHPDTLASSAVLMKWKTEKMELADTQQSSAEAPP